MKPVRSFVAERVLAAHCPELFRQGSASGAHPADLQPAFARAGEKLARGFAAALAPLLGGQAPTIACEPVRESDMAALLAESAPLAANCLMAAGPASAPLLASIDAGAVLRIVDRTFGGKGVAPSPLPEKFSLSAEIMVKRLETLLAASLGEALGLAGGVETIRHDGSLAALEPFAAGTPLAVQVLTVEEPGQASWQFALAVPLTTLAALFGEGKQTAPRAAARRAASPTDEPFCDVPLTVSAIVVDMRLAMSALADLRPGAVIPVSVARNVPLRIGDKTVAHGSIGAVDDRVAIQISQSF